MSRQPRIGISGSHMIDGGGMFPGYKRSYVNDDYITSVIRAGGIPFILPFTEDESVVKEMMQHVDGLLLSGGHDLYPLYYGEEPLQGIGDVWPERDVFDFTLLREAKERQLPIMGICRGHQIVNVFHGGTLYQDLKYDPNCTIKHSQNQRAELATHTVLIDEDSRVANIIGTTEVLTNSHHHQTVRRIGEGLRVTGRAKDGTIEIMEGTDYPYLMTYQFHPEMMSRTASFAHELFVDFIRHATKE